MIKLTDFDYRLPKELIAQRPLPNREDSRLLVLSREEGTIKHLGFKDLPRFLNRDDILVINETRVFKARIFGRREGFEGKIEVLLCDKLEENLYTALCNPSPRFKEGTKIIFGNGRLQAEVIARSDNFKILRFENNNSLYSILEEIGEIPLPPYIKRPPDQDDEDRYQTVYARNIGAIAAPTAGLHFTEELIDELKDLGIDFVPLTLHVGYATFKPVKEQDITKHKMHREYFEIPEETAGKINQAKKDGGRVVAVGTTTCRALESATKLPTTNYQLQTASGFTDLFIYPGYDFKITDGLLTNFHLPRTTLLMLVSAFCGRDNLLRAYREAIEEGYRFYSYGDAMLIT